MKRAWIDIATLALLALPAVAQVRGVPASVTSMAPWRSFTPGPPASVTSLGPNGFSAPCSSPGPLIPSAMGCTPTQFTTGNFFPVPRDRGKINLHPRHRYGGAYAYPVYVPYAYPVMAEPVPEVEAEQEPPALTVFENRPTYQRPPYGNAVESARYGTHYFDGQQPAAPAAPSGPAPDTTSAPPDTREQEPILLIFRDGHQQEVKNYAIIGQTLYDLGTFVARKIPLAALDLKATLKANDERGVEFSLPSSVHLD